MDNSHVYKSNKESLLSRRAMKPVSIVNKSSASNEANYNQRPNRDNNVCNQIYGDIEANNNNNYSNNSGISNFDPNIKDYMEGDPSVSDIFSAKDESNLSSVFQGDWPMHKRYLPSNGEHSGDTAEGLLDTASIMSFNSSVTTNSVANPQIGDETKVENMKADICSLLSKLETHNKIDVAKQLLQMSSSEESSIAMANSGCITHVVQLLHEQGRSESLSAHRQRMELRKMASLILQNLVSSQESGDKREREVNVLRLLEQVRNYCDFLRNSQYEVTDNATCTDQQFGPVVASLMKLSFDEDHRHSMCLLGGLQSVAELIMIEQEVHGCMNDKYCVMVRRYSGMTLTNLTFGDGTNKSLLCSMKPLMCALVAQLRSPSEELRQVSASVLRNLSWKADFESKKTLREVGAVPTLTKAAMDATKESTLKSILSALWNLSAHCSENKVDICKVEGALGFLVSTLTYRSSSKNLSVIENGGGILRNVSSHIAVQNEHRITLRKHNCIQILLHHLKSSSLTVVSNACGTLWNLSARNAEDQRALWEMGAVGMLKKLVNSKHKMISMGSSAALKNLLAAQPAGISGGLGILGSDCNSDMPSLHIRKLKTLNADIDQNLSETYDITDSPKSSPTHRSTQSKPSSNSSNSTHRSGTSVRQSERNESKEKAPKPEISHLPVPMNNITRNSSDHDPVPSKPFANQKQNVIKHRSVSQSPNRAAELSTAPARGTISKLNNFNNVRPHSAPARRDNRSLSAAPPQNKLNNSNRVNLSKTTAPSNKHNYSNWAQKIKDLKLEDTYSQEKPVNYSLKYSEEAAASSQSQNVNFNKKATPESKIPQPKINNFIDTGYAQTSSIPSKNNTNQCNSTQNKVQPKQSYRKSANIYNSYAESDEEQPIDFSRKYEEQSNACEYLPQHSTRNNQASYVDDSKSKNPSKFNLYCADTVKVYCTEGTPLNFSSSSSMTDLRDIDAQSHVSINSFPEDNEQRFIDGPGDEIAENFTEDCEQVFEPKNGKKKHRMQPRSPKSKHKKEDKNVKVEGEANFPDETPLMFSRSSSLGSLSSFDQPSIQDDRSSVSDFSRLASGVISPSELPDSPGGTVPPSPRQKKAETFSFSNNAAVGKSNICSRKSQHPISEDKHIPYDEVKNTFTPVEGTPAEFSGASSLSSLSFGSDHKHAVSSKNLNDDLKQSYESNGKKQMNKEQFYAQEHSACASKPNDFLCKSNSNVEGTPVCFSRNSSLSSLSIESGDEISSAEKAMLQECIQFGMPKRKEQNDSFCSKKPENSDLKSLLSQKISKEKPNVSHSRNSSRGSSISMESGDEMSSAEKALLDEYIQLGMPKRKPIKENCNFQAKQTVNETVNVCQSRNSSRASSASVESGDELSSAEKALLQECIQLGMPKRKTADKDSNAQVTGKTAVNHTTAERLNNFTLKSDGGVSRDNSCPKDPTVVKNCIQSAMPKGNDSKEILHPNRGVSSSTFPANYTKTRPSIEGETGHSRSSSRSSSVSMESGDEITCAEKDLLQQCILQGMPKRKEQKDQFVNQKMCPNSNIQNVRNTVDAVNETKPWHSCEENRAVGHSRNSSISSSTSTESGDELSLAEKALLQQCILQGMPKRKDSTNQSICTNSDGRNPTDTPCETKLKGNTPLSNSRRSSVSSSSSIESGGDLTTVEQALLQQCIQQGMPKRKDSDVGQLMSDASSETVKNIAKPENNLRNQPIKQSPNPVPTQNGNKIVKSGNGKPPPTHAPSNISESNAVDHLEIFNEAQRLAEDMLEAVVDGTEDMTVSTLSCLSDLDNAHPPSAMADLSCLTMNNSFVCEDQKSAKPSRVHLSYKNSLLKDLQISKLNNDQLQNMSASSENLSNSTTDIVENINPPSLLDNMSFTGSTGSLNSLSSDILDSKYDCGKVTKVKVLNDNCMDERLCDAATMAQMYARELSNITGATAKDPESVAEVANIAPQAAIQAVMNCLEDVTDLACDTIGSDGDNVDDLPCDDESETLIAPQLSSLMRDDVDGSTENLTVTLTEEPQRTKNGEQEDLDNQEDFEMLRENADLILKSLRKLRCSESSDLGCLASNELLEDETMSLVSNESDDDSLSPDGVFCNRDAASDPEVSSFSKNRKHRGVTNDLSSPIGLPICTQFAERKKFGFSGSSKNRQTFAPNPNCNQSGQSNECSNKIPFDSSTFTRKKPSSGNKIPTVNSYQDANKILAPSNCSSRESIDSSSTTTSSVSSSGKPSSIKKVVSSKIAAVWKNSNKSRSKSTVDIQRNKFAGEKSLIAAQNDADNRPSSSKPLSRSSTAENVRDNPDTKITQRRPTSLMFSRNTDTSNSDADSANASPLASKISLCNSSPSTPTSRQEKSNATPFKIQPMGRKSLIPLSKPNDSNEQKSGLSTMV